MVWGYFFSPSYITSSKQDCNYSVKEKKQIYSLTTVKAIILTNRGQKLIKNSYDFCLVPDYVISLFYLWEDTHCLSYS